MEKAVAPLQMLTGGRVAAKSLKTKARESAVTRENSGHMRADIA